MKESKDTVFFLTSLLAVIGGLSLSFLDFGAKENSDSPSSRGQSVSATDLSSPSVRAGKEASSEQVSMAAKAFQPALARIEEEQDPQERPGMLLDLLSGASVEDVLQVLALSDAPGVYSIGFRDEIKAAAYERWYALDPAAAIRAEADSDLTPARKDSVVEALLEDWASKAPKEVKAFLQEGELPEVSADQVYGAVARGSSQQGDAEVVAFALEKIQDPRLHSYAVRSVARFLQNGYGEIFDEWVTALPREQQELAIAESAWILASKNIELALNGLDRLAEMGAENAPVTRARVMVQWAKEEPQMAGEWVMEQRLPAAERETLFGSVFRAWLSDDQSAAVAWADSLIAEGAIDEALMNRVLRN